MREYMPIQQEGSVSFRPHARLIRLLGDELISDEVMAIVELVKNGYDADSTHVSVTLKDVTDQDNGCISVRDDGSGMDMHTLLNVWMEPATSHKRRDRRNKVRTPKGRIQSGEKGVGRFAADKLGAELELVTKTANMSQELVLQVNWNRFDENRYLEDVESSWYLREPVVFPEQGHGTLLVVRSLRTVWTREMADKLNNGLIRLLSPFSDNADFVIEVHCPEFPSMSGKLVNRILETAPYRLSGVVDDHGCLHVENSPEQPVDLRRLCHNQFLIDREIRQPVCGPFKISLNVWDLELQLGKGVGVDRSLREAIKASSGVSIYRDGFRIWPYGEKDDDWLELNQRRVNNPTLRISNNQIIGFIEITHADNPDLKDRTSREGLIDTPAFFDLKALVLAAVAELETVRFNCRHQVTTAPPSSDEDNKDDLLRYLATAGHNKQSGSHLAIKEIERLYRKKIEQDQTRYNYIATMAGVGLAAEFLSDAFTHEVSHVKTLLRIMQGEAQANAEPSMRQLVDVLSKHVNVLNEQLDMMEPLYHPRLHDNEPLDVKGTAYDVISTLRYKLSETNTTVALGGVQGLTVRIGKGHLMLAMMVLVENALRAMSDARVTDPRLDIQVVSEEHFCGVRISDNGPGISKKYHKLIFEPAFTMRSTSRGLGLYVAKDILSTYNSSVELVSEETPLLGACFVIRFDKRRVISASKKG